MKHILMILAAVLMTYGCQQKNTNAEKAEEPAIVEQQSDKTSPFIVDDEGSLVFPTPSGGSPAAILDSMLSFQSIDAAPARKAAHEWKWAKQARQALGSSDDTIDLEHLDAVAFGVDSIYAPLTAYSQSDMNQAAGMFAATACFRLLNAYQKWADMISHSLDESQLLQDYTLWEGVYKEYADNYTDGGSSMPMMLSIAHKKLSELRLSVLKEEIGYLEADRHGAADWYVDADEIQCKPYQKAILLWYNHRMKMADRLQEVSNTHAEYLRHMTCKTVFIYQHLRLGWQSE